MVLVQDESMTHSGAVFDPAVGKFCNRTPAASSSIKIANSRAAISSLQLLQSLHHPLAQLFRAPMDVFKRRVGRRGMEDAFQIHSDQVKFLGRHLVDDGLQFITSRHGGKAIISECWIKSFLRSCALRLTALTVPRLRHG